MQAKAVAKYVRVSPYKARPVADLIRGKGANEALLQLQTTGRKAGFHLGKVLKSAMANAELEHGARPESLHVLEVRVDEGPTLKRAKPESKGRRAPILKRSSHLTVVVG
ncbi:MAG: 50S ribosomal protein L22 [Parachlamydiales bacterium]